MSKRARVIIGITVGVIAIAAIGIILAFRALEPTMHDWVTSNLSKALDSEIELGQVHIRWVPLQLHAHDLTVRHHGRTDIPPLIVVKKFIVDLKPMDLRSSTIDRVWVDGLEVSIPPKDPDTGKRPLPRKTGGDGGSESSGFVIRELIASNAKFTVVPGNPNKDPKEWDVYALDMKNLRAGEPATFTASVNNPIPVGRIEASGKFGPWQKTEPRTTALSGEYTFDADLGTIEGLGGKLGAIGTMSGTIEEIATQGQTKTPDFRLTELDGHPVPLQTAYDAIVDGTKGDVELKRVDVTLGKSQFDLRGLIEGTKGVKGKRVVVNVKSNSANLGDLLRFVSKKEPAAEGVLRIDAAMDLPQGKAKVLERIRLEGSVRADRVKFTKDVVQDKIDDLSRKAQGRPTDTTIDEVASQMATKFSLANGVFTYQGMSFKIQGASVQLAGTHSLRSRVVDLSGVALLDATVSQTQTGYKSWLLKPFDPLFKKNGAGTRLSITVAGTQDQPKIGLDIGKTLKGK
ncbi:MAG TPA: AsmA-like C-terminal region-containing protein [Vicinamibacterales bacterium]|nr:AsmA-like C-terminal region-containing protein [Vicinamibacterales bacterium]